MKKTFKVTVELNMNASNKVEILVRTNNERNAAKLATKEAIKKHKARFTIVKFIEEIK